MREYKPILRTVVLVSLCFTFGFAQYRQISKLSIDMEVKTWEKGKYVTQKGSVFYEVSKGVMTTKFNYPLNQITITNANGELKHYDQDKNTVMVMQGLSYSSRNSFFHYFLNGKINDMGLAGDNYKLNSTEIKDGMVVTKWEFPKHPQFQDVELVHENNLPIYMCFYKYKKPVYKVYYANFLNAGNYVLPSRITEIEYVNETDSVVTSKKYKNLKLNEAVDPTYIDFQIPKDATLINAN